MPKSEWQTLLMRIFFMWFWDTELFRFCLMISIYVKSWDQSISRYVNSEPKNNKKNLPCDEILKNVDFSFWGKHCAQRSDFEIVAHKHEQAQDPNFHFKSPKAFGDF